MGFGCAVDSHLALPGLSLADIHIDNINMTLVGRELLIDASLALNWGQRYGANDCCATPSFSNPAKCPSRPSLT